MNTTYSYEILGKFVLIFVLPLLVVSVITMILGFIFQALHKQIIGGKLLRFGAGCGVVIFSTLLVTASILHGRYYHIILAVFIVCVVIMLPRRSKINACPQCRGKITWEDRMKLCKPFGIRSQSSCPHCSTNFVFSKWPWRIACISCYLSIPLIILKFIGVEFEIFFGIIWYAIVIMLTISLFTLKLEKVKPE